MANEEKRQDLPEEYKDLVSDEDIPQPESKPYRAPGAARGIIYAALVLAAAIVLAVLAWKCVDEVCALTDDDEVVTVTVAENDTMSQVAKQLKSKGLIQYRWLFNLYCMASGAEDKIDPGTYDLNKIFDYHALVCGMMKTSANRATVLVTIPEGYEADDIFALLEENGVCTAAKLEKAAASYEYDYWFLEGLEYGDYRRLEGYLFPDTYQFYVDDTPENVLSRFLKNFESKVTEDLQKDLDGLNTALRLKMEAAGFEDAEIEGKLLTMQDVIIVASLIEKETTSAADSGKIASVIYNRLCSKLYPCLNIDATVQYVLPERKETLSNADKAVVSPYNTYTHAGLPVGPISNPGMASIRAALYPVDTDYYFYVRDPAGGHHFSADAFDYQAFLDKLAGKTQDEPEEAADEE